MIWFQHFCINFFNHVNYCKLFAPKFILLVNLFLRQGLITEACFNQNVNFIFDRCKMINNSHK